MQKDGVEQRQTKKVGVVGEVSWDAGHQEDLWGETGQGRKGQTPEQGLQWLVAVKVAELRT